MIKGGKTIVCDIGAGSIKIGFAGSLTPEQVIPTVVAIPRRSEAIQDVLVGKEALSIQGRKNYSFLRPIDEQGIVQNWTALEAIIQYSLQAIGIACYRNHKILLAKPRSMSQADLQYLLDLLFNKLQFAAVTLHEQAALVLYTQGVDTGIVVELGETMASIVPVYHGFAIPKLNRRMEVGGRSISQFLAKLLKKRGCHKDAVDNLETVREIKEQEAYVSLDHMREKYLVAGRSTLEKTISFPDGVTISIGKERFDAPEALFQPKFWDSEENGLSDLIFEMIQEAPIDCRVDLYQNIILSGGSSLFPGVQDRLQLDLTNRYETLIRKGTKQPTIISRNWKLQVHAPVARQFAVFEGAALFADLICEDCKFWVTQPQYREKGGTQLFLKKPQVF